MKKILFILALLFPVLAFAQFPANPNKIRLGFQTTGDGLTYRGSGAPVYVPRIILGAWTYLDTVSNILYAYQGGFWNPIPGARNGLSQDSGPSTGQIVLGGTLDRNTIVESLTYDWRLGRNQSGYETYINGYAGGTFIGMRATLSGRGTDLTMSRNGWLLEHENQANTKIAQIAAQDGQISLTTTNSVFSPTRIRVFTADTAFTFNRLDSFPTHAAADASPLIRAHSLYRLNNSRVVYIRNGIGTADAITQSSGTPGTLPIWATANSLGDSPYTISGQVSRLGLTGAFRLPIGTTAQRPTNEAGLLRWNTTTGAPDIMDGTNVRRLTMQTDAAFTDRQIPFSGSTGILQGGNITYGGANASGLYVQGTAGSWTTTQQLLRLSSGNFDRFFRVESFQDPFNGAATAFQMGAASTRIWLQGQYYTSNMWFTVPSGSDLRFELGAGPGLYLGANSGTGLLAGDNGTAASSAHLTFVSYGTTRGNPLKFRHAGSSSVSAANEGDRFEFTADEAGSPTFRLFAVTNPNGPKPWSLQILNSGNVGLGRAAASNYDLAIGGTAGTILSGGTTAQRPTATAGGFRYKTDGTAGLEWSDGTNWYLIPTSYPNLFNFSGTLTGNRILDGGTFTLDLGTGVWGNLPTLRLYPNRIYAYGGNGGNSYYEWDVTDNYFSLFANNDGNFAKRFIAQDTSIRVGTQQLISTGDWVDLMISRNSFRVLGREAGTTWQYNLPTIGNPHTSGIMVFNAAGQGFWQSATGLGTNLANADLVQTAGQDRTYNGSGRGLEFSNMDYFLVSGNNFSVETNEVLVEMNSNNLSLEFSKAGNTGLMGFTQFGYSADFTIGSGSGLRRGAYESTGDSLLISWQNGTTPEGKLYLPRERANAAADAKNAIEWQGTGATYAQPKLVPTGQTGKYITTSTTYTATDLGKQRELVIWANLAAGSVAQLAITIPDPGSAYENSLVTIYCEDASATYSIEAVAASAGNSFYIPTTAGSAPAATSLLGLTDASNPWFRPGATITLRCLNRNGTWYWVPGLTSNN